jgi:monoamine oxidase
MEALNELQYARIMKASILFNNRFWDDEAFDMITDTPGQYFFHSTKLQKSEKGILTSYTIGDKAYALSKMNQKQRTQTIIDSLKPAFGDVAKYADKSISYYWGSDVHTQGAYAIYDTRQWFSVRPVIKEPFKNIFFAGEHIAEWQGFMEGAVEMGFEAAEHAMS